MSKLMNEVYTVFVMYCLGYSIMIVVHSRFILKTLTR